jgi:hypothetical protein
MAPADGVRYAILLWPSKVPATCGREIDFGEDNGGNRTSSELTVQLHGGTLDGRPTITVHSAHVPHDREKVGEIV